MYDDDDDCTQTIYNVAKETDAFMDILKNNNITIKDQSSIIKICYELCNVHLKNAFKKNDIDTAKKILQLFLEKINQAKQKMKDKFYESKNMSTSQKKVLFDRMKASNKMLQSDIDDLKARKKAISEFNVTGDDTITIINDILNSALSYLYYRKFCSQNLEK